MGKLSIRDKYLQAAQEAMNDSTDPVEIPDDAEVQIDEDGAQITFTFSLFVDSSEI